MRLSNLQKYIILESFLNSGKISSLERLIEFYKNKPPKNAKGIITKSLERLIKKGLISIIGKKTAHKLFIKEIRLTNIGCKLAKEILDQRQKLPIKIKKKYGHS